MLLLPQEKKRRREENLRRRLENERKAEIVQVVSGDHQTTEDWGSSLLQLLSSPPVPLLGSSCEQHWEDWGIPTDLNYSRKVSSLVPSRVGLRGETTSLSSWRKPKRGSPWEGSVMLGGIQAGSHGKIMVIPSGRDLGGKLGAGGNPGMIM